jgi:membrane protease YdiL (CAAX protease family)
VRPGDPARTGAGLFRLAAWVYLVLAVFGVGWIGVRHQGVPLALFLPAPPYWIDPCLGVAGATVPVLLWRAASGLRLARQLEARLRERLGALTSAEVYGLALLSGVAEEVFFRGAMQPAWGYVPATLLFAALHSGRGREMILWAFSALVAGALLGAIMLSRGTLFAPILCHALVNAVQLRRLLTAGNGP